VDFTFALIAFKSTLPVNNETQNSKILIEYAINSMLKYIAS